MSEQILNGTSAQLGYTVPFTSVHAGKYKTEDKLKTDTTKTKHNPEKQTTQNTAKQNYRGLVASYDTRPGNVMGLFYKSPETTRGVNQYYCTITRGDQPWRALLHFIVGWMGG